jgi:hypothetical protein
MISSNIHMDYLMPETWTNLGVILSFLNPQYRILHILKTEAGKYKGITSDHEKIILEEMIYSDQPDIQGIFLKYDSINEIRVYTLAGLESYYRKVQDSSVYRMDIDDYLIYLYQTLEQTEGIQIYTRTINKRCYLEGLKLLINPNAEQGAFLLWLTDHGKLYFNCILEYKEGMLVRITTTDRYQEAYNSYEEVCSRLKLEYPNSMQCVNMELKEFAEKINILYENL